MLGSLGFGALGFRVLGFVCWGLGVWVFSAFWDLGVSGFRGFEVSVLWLMVQILKSRLYSATVAM